MPDECAHARTIRNVTPSALGCEECLKLGSAWVHLRLCRTCGHVGCCDSSPNRHATKHFRKTRHPIIEGYDPPEGWGWCYIDEISLDLGGRTTPHNGHQSRGTIKFAAWGKIAPAPSMPGTQCRAGTYVQRHKRPRGFVLPCWKGREKKKA